MIRQLPDEQVIDSGIEPAQGVDAAAEDRALRGRQLER
jgi:hypothetical protein